MYKLNDLVGYMYISPIILCGTVEKIWTKPNTPLFKVWQKMGLITKSGVLTPLGKQICELEIFFNYHDEAADGLLSGISPDYGLLHEGWHERAFQFKDVAMTVADTCNLPSHILDLGGGLGSWAYMIRLHIAHKQPGNVPICEVVDKVRIEEKRRLNYLIYHQATIEEYLGKKDRKLSGLVCLSEILHLLGEEEGKKVLVQLHDLGAEYIFIWENLPDPILQWRLEEFSSQNPHLWTHNEMFDLLNSTTPWQPIMGGEVEDHYYIVCKRSPTA